MKEDASFNNLSLIDTSITTNNPLLKQNWIESKNVSITAIEDWQ